MVHLLDKVVSDSTILNLYKFLHFCVFRLRFVSQKKSPRGSARRRYAYASPTCPTGSTLLPRDHQLEPPIHQLEPPPNGAIWRLHCPYDARSTSCLIGKPNVNQTQDKMIFSNHCPLPIAIAHCRFLPLWS